MKTFLTTTSIVTPLPIKDIDTDMIIPAQYLTSISREGFGQHLFTRLKASNRSFALNDVRFSGSQILLADSNFGCGSSREHAVWAITQAGFKVVIAKSFADIFASNSAKNGLLLVQLPASDVDLLLSEAQNEPLAVTVDLEKEQVVALNGRTWSFSCDPFTKHFFLNGLDDLEYLRSQLTAILLKKTELSQQFFFDARTPNRPLPSLPIEDVGTR